MSYYHVFIPNAFIVQQERSDDDEVTVPGANARMIHINLSFS